METDAYMTVIAELHSKGLISDECVIKLGRLMKLASEEQATMTKSAAIKIAFNPRGLGEMIGNTVRSGGERLMGVLNPLGEGLAAGFRGPQPVQSALGSMTGALRTGAQNFISSPIGSHLAMGGAMAAGGAIANAIGGAFQKLKITQAKAQMLQQFPELAQADPAQVDQVFDTVSSIAPHVASQPRLVGTFVQGVLQFPGAAITPEMGQSLMRLEEQLAGQPGAGHAFLEGAMGQAGKGMVSQALPQQKDMWDKAQIVGGLGKTVAEFGGPVGFGRSLLGGVASKGGAGYKGSYRGAA